MQKSKKEATNFDTEFTKEDPVLTPINQDIVRTINQVNISPHSSDLETHSGPMIDSSPLTIICVALSLKLLLTRMCLTGGVRWFQL